MDEHLFFEGEKFLSSKSAASQAGFTNDYVSRLCREGKVNARRVGRVWYVSEDSLNAFLRRNEQEKELQRNELSRQRRKELEACAAGQKSAEASNADAVQTSKAPLSRLPELSSKFSTELVKYQPVLSPVSLKFLEKAGALITTFALVFGSVAAFQIPEVQSLAKRAGVETRAALIMFETKLEALPPVAAQKTLASAQFIVGSVLELPENATELAHDAGRGFVRLPEMLKTAIPEAARALAYLPEGFADVMESNAVRLYRGTHTAFSSAGSVRIDEVDSFTADVSRSFAGTFANSSFAERIASWREFGSEFALHTLSLSAESFAGVRTFLDSHESDLVERTLAAASNQSTSLSFFSRVTTTVLGFFGFGEDEPVLTAETVLPVPPVSSDRDVAAEPRPATSGSTTVINQPVREVVTERVVERVETLSGVSSEEFERRLQELDNKLTSRIYSISGADNSNNIQTVYKTVALTNRINKLDNVVFNDGSITGDTTFSGTTVDGTFFTGDNATFGGLTVTGGTTFLGQTQMSYFTATSTTNPSTVDYRFGVGTSTPSAKIGITGTGTTTGRAFVIADANDLETFTVLDSGRVGVGTTSPSSNFAVAGSGFFDGNLTVTGILATSTITGTRFVATDGSATSTFAGGLTIEDDGFVYDHQTNRVGIGTSSPFARFSIAGSSGGTEPLFSISTSTASATSTAIIVNSDGWLGIGTSSPSAALSVQGDVLVNGNFTITDFETEGTFTSNGLSTFADGFVSQASSTVSSGGLTTVGYSTTTQALIVQGANATSTFAGGLAIETSGFVYDFSSNRIGIGTNSPASILDISGTDALRIPVGTTGERPVMELLGQVRYNTTNGQFEGYDGSFWQGLGGVIDVDLDTYIEPEESTDEDFLRFFTAGSQRFTISNTGNVGVATSSPFERFSVLGNSYFGGTITATSTITGTNFVANDGAATSTLAGGLAIEDDGFVYDYQTNRVGVGTSSPFTNFSVTGNGFFSGGLGIGVSTTTAGAFQTSGSARIGGSLQVDGNATIIGGTSADTLTINSTINSNLIPDQNAARDLGSPALYWDDVYVDNLNANNVSAASTTISGTKSADFTLNTDNTTADTEDANFIFFRGTVVPNALITWDSTLDRFDLNQPIFFQNDSSTTTVISLETRAKSGQTADIFRAADSSGTSFFNVTSDGKVGIGTTSPSKLLSIAGSALFDGDLTVSNLTATSSITVPNISLSGIGSNVLLSLDSSGNVVGSTTPSVASIIATSTTATSTFAGGLAVETSGFVYDFSSGNVGIGTASPSENLEISGSSSQTLKLTNTSGPNLTISTGSGTPSLISSAGFNVRANSSDYIGFQIGVTEQARIDSDGDLGVGTTSPWGKLSVTNAGSGPSFVVEDSSSPDSTPFIIDAAGSVGIGTAAPNKLLDVFVGATDGNGIAISEDSVGAFILQGDFAGTGADNKFHISATSYAGGTFADPAELLTVIGSTGNVGIGTTSPFGKLSVTGDGTSGGTALLVADSADTKRFEVLDNGRTFVRTTSDEDNYIRIGDTSATEALSIYAQDSSVDGGTGSWFLGYRATTDELNLLTYGPKAITFGTQGSERLRITSGGNVGIGHTNPSEKLNVQGEAAAQFFTATSTTATSTFAGGLAVETSGLVYDFSSGNVGIGTAAPSETLDVNGNANLDGELRFTRTTDTTLIRSFTSNNNDLTLLRVSGDAAGALTDDDAAYGFSLKYLGSGSGNNNSLALFADNQSGTAIEALSILQDGRIGVASSTPWGRFSVQAASGQTAPNFVVADSSGNTDLVVEAGGNVGIGTANPTSAKLTILNGADADVVGQVFGASLDDYLGLGYNSDTAVITAGSSGSGSINLAFHTAIAGTEAERARLTSGGNFGIGTTTPDAPLVVSRGNFVGDILKLERTLSGSPVVGAFDIQTPGGGTNYLGLDVTDGGSTAYNLILQASGGNVGIGTNSPNAELVVQNSSDNSDILQILNAAGTRVANLSSDPSGDGVLIVRDSTGSIQHYVDGDSSTPTYFNAGNIGIGTTSPTALLHVEKNQNAATEFKLFNTDTGGSARANVWLGESTSHGLFIQGATDAQSASSILALGGTDNLNLGTQGVTNVTIEAGGDVGIGTTSPSSKFHVYNSTGDLNPTFETGSGRSFITLDGTRTTDAEVGSLLFSNAGDSVALIASYRDGANDAGNLRFQTQETGSGTLAERMRITSDGKVGIGTTTPQSILTVTSEHPELRVMSNSTSGVSSIGIWPRQSFDSGNDNAQLELNYDDVTNLASLKFNANGLRFIENNSGTESTRLTIDSAGDVGIGSTSPWGKLSVTNTGSGASFAVEDQDSDATPFVIDAAGAVGIGLANPDAKLHVSNGVSDNIIRLGQTASNEYGQFTYDRSGVTAFNFDNRYGGTNTAASINFQHGGATKLTILGTGRVGIGTTTPGATLQVVHGSDGILFGDETDDSTAKFGRLGTPHYDTSEEPFYAVLPWSTSSTNQLFLGGGTSVGNAATHIQFYTAANNTTTTGTERVRIDSSGRVGIGTTSPYAKLSVVGEVVAEKFTATSTAATSTFAGGFEVGGGAIRHDWNTGVTSVDSLQLGALNFETNAGVVSWTDLPVTSAAAAGTVMSYTAQIDGEGLLTIYSESDGSGGIQNSGVGIGTSSPWRALSVEGSSDLGHDALAGTFTATSTTATSTFAGGLAVDTSGLVYNFSSGNVGIGTESPETPLHVDGTLALERTSGTAGQNSQWNFSHTANFENSVNNNELLLEIQDEDGAFIISPAGSDGRNAITYFDSSGRVGIGTANPQTALDVTGTASSTRFYANDGDVSAPAFTFAGNTDLGFYRSGGSIRASVDGTERIRIEGSTTNFFQDISLGGGTGYALIQGNTAGSASGPVYTFTGDENTGIYRAGADDLRLVTGGSDRLTVDSSGRVGIGDATPDAKLQVADADALEFRLTDNNDGSAVVRYDSDTAYFLTESGVSANRNLAFGSQSSAGSAVTEYARFDVDGNLGIGTTTPNGKLTIYNGGSGFPSVSGNADDLVISSGGNTGITLFSPSSADNNIFFGDTDSAGAGNITYSHSTNDLTLEAGGDLVLQAADGNVGIGTASPGHPLEISGTSALLGAGAGFTLNLHNTSNYIQLLSNQFNFTTNQSQGFTFTGGNVGIGSTTPNAKLVVWADTNNVEDGLQLGNNGQGGNPWFIGREGNTTGRLAIGNGSELVSILTGGNVGIGTTTSSARLSVGYDASGTEFLVESNSGSVAALQVQNGFVGIGYSPSDTINEYTLDVKGSIRAGNGVLAANSGGSGSVANLTFDDDINTGFNNPTADTLTVLTGGSERMRIGPAGNVGIGTTSPFAELSVAGDIYADGNLTVSGLTSTTTLSLADGSASTPALNFTSDTNTGLYAKGADNIGFAAGGNEIFNLSTSAFQAANGSGPALLNEAASATNPTLVPNKNDPDTGIGSSGADALSFITGGTERIRTNSSGNVSINTTSTGGRLSVQANTWSENALALYSSNDAGNTDFTGLAFYNSSGTGVADIYTHESDGTISITATNGVRLKYGSSGISGGTEALRVDSDGDVGIGTTSPWKKLSVTETVSDAQFSIAYDDTRYTNFQTDSAGDLAIDAQGGDVFLNDENLWVCTGGACPTGAPSGTGNLVVESNFLVGTTTAQQEATIEGDLFVANGWPAALGTATSTFKGDIIIDGKLDVGTIDPVYTIDGVKYATYGHSTIGIKEEAMVTLAVAEYNEESGYYERAIRFSDLEEGSDLWLFYQITNFGGEDWDKLVVNLTPAFDGTVFYEKQPATSSIVLKSTKPGEVSARFVADRFDAAEWPNLRPDQDGGYKGFEISAKNK